MAKPSIPQGTRDFGPETVRKRNYIFNTIRSVFEVYGFQPLETPAMENLDTLLGKYGDEGDKLIFKILNNGLNDPKNSDKARTAFENVLKGKNDKDITERAMKYDLTIPFARYVAMNHGQLTFPFKRYQIQPVWRADRPQKGRYREFYQCDADVVGSNSLLNEIELAIIYNTVFNKLGIKNYELRINNRKVLKGIMEVCGVENYEKKILVIIDKTDKIGNDGVKQELSNENIAITKLEKLLEIFSFTGTNTEKITFLKEYLAASPTGIEGLNELDLVIKTISKENPTSSIQIDLTLARGLDYYTGIIFEAKAPAEVKIGSIGGGGRYDDLTGLFGVPNIPGVGISFGVDRIYDVMEELQLFPAEVHTGTQLLFFNLGEAESQTAFSIMQQLRDKHIRCELFHENVKFDKQFKYAEKKNIPFVAIIGDKELKEKTVTIKDIRKGEQQTLSVEQLLTLSIFN